MHIIGHQGESGGNARTNLGGNGSLDVGIAGGETLETRALCRAVAATSRTIGLDTRYIPLMKSLIRSRLGPITVDQETSTVRLVHATLHEYLSSHIDISHRGLETITGACLAHLSPGSTKTASKAS